MNHCAAQQNRTDSWNKKQWTKRFNKCALWLILYSFYFRKISATLRLLLVSTSFFSFSFSQSLCTVLYDSFEFTLRISRYFRESSILFYVYFIGMHTFALKWSFFLEKKRRFCCVCWSKAWSQHLVETKHQYSWNEMAPF